MLKKKEICEGIIEYCEYPDTGIFFGPDGEKIRIKHVIPGQKVRAVITKKREKYLEGRLLNTESAAAEFENAPCPSFPNCGGCLYQKLPYDTQLRLKEETLSRLLGPSLAGQNAVYDGIIPSPHPYGYRNKMEFSFGDSEKGGILQLGFHKRGTAYDVMPGEGCMLVHEDVRILLGLILDYCREKDLPMYRKSTHEGYLRHLLVRRSETDGTVLLCLVTSTQMKHDFRELVQRLLAAQDRMEGRIGGIVHGNNDLPADTVQLESAQILYGKDSLAETVLGLSFSISLFSFFQTNTGGAARLYSKVREYLREYASSTGRKPVLYDLYSGTGTIAQILSAEAENVYAVELVEEAVEAARRNAEKNGIQNCSFYCGDVGAVLENGIIPGRPDFIVLDPPREGLTPKALRHVLCLGVPNMIYISCKATSFVRDMAELSRAGYRITRWCLCDLFPQTPHVECVTLMTKK